MPSYGGSSYGAGSYSGGSSSGTVTITPTWWLDETFADPYLYLSPPPPPPIVPGAAGSDHDYELISVDRFGIPFGTIANAVVDDVTWELDKALAMTFHAPTLEPSLKEYLPLDTIPFVREVQFWRDGVLIAWGGPTLPNIDRTVASFQCQGFTWLLENELFGPLTQEFLQNPDFELDPALTGWHASACTIGRKDATTGIVNTGKYSMQIDPIAPGGVGYAYQNVTLHDVTMGEGTAYILSGWYYIESPTLLGTFAGPAALNAGLAVAPLAGVIIPDGALGPGGSVYAEITASTAINGWVRVETAFTIPPGGTATVQVRCFGVGDAVIFWDSLQLRIEESVGTPLGGGELINLFANVILYSEQVVNGKSPHNWTVWGGPTGVILERHYQFFDNGIIADAIYEYPSIGAIDWAETWTADGRNRGWSVYHPQQGKLRYDIAVDGTEENITQLQVGVDGTKTKTTNRVLGQGTTGVNREIGYSAFPSYLGGRVMTDGVLVQGWTVLESATANFTAADIFEGIYSLDGLLPIGTFITGIIDSSHVNISQAALATASAETIGVGGLVLDGQVSAQPDLPMSSLFNQAKTATLYSSVPIKVVTIRLPASGPDSIFGILHLGDSIPVTIDYGVVQIAMIMRAVKIVYYPPTEEIEVTFNPIPGYFNSYGISG